MNLETLDTYVLNDTAARVWSLVDGLRNVSDITAILQSEYEVNNTDCYNSLQQLLIEFAEAGLICYDDHG